MRHVTCTFENIYMLCVLKLNICTEQDYIPLN